MKTFIMAVTFQIGVDVLGFIKEFKHNVHLIQEEQYKSKKNRFHDDKTKQMNQRLWVYKIEQMYI